MHAREAFRKSRSRFDNSYCGEKFELNGGGKAFGAERRRKETNDAIEASLSRSSDSFGTLWRF